MSGVTFERLPPERRIAAPNAASAGSCCCCCCCCLHTVGSLVGALSAKTPKPPEDTVPMAVIGTDRVEPNYKVTKEYWATVLILTTIALPLYAISEGGNEPLEWAFAAAIFMPGMQLLASLIVAIITSASKRPGKDQRMRHLGSITGRAFIGGLLGLFAMIVFFQFM